MRVLRLIQGELMRNTYFFSNGGIYVNELTMTSKSCLLFGSRLTWFIFQNLWEHLNVPEKLEWMIISRNDEKKKSVLFIYLFGWWLLVVGLYFLCRNAKNSPDIYIYIKNIEKWFWSGSKCHWNKYFRISVH